VLVSSLNRPWDAKRHQRTPSAITVTAGNGARQRISPVEQRGRLDGRRIFYAAHRARPPLPGIGPAARRIEFGRQLLRTDRYWGGGGATGWHALAPGFHQLPGPQSGGGGGATGWHALAAGFHQLPGPQSWGGGGATGWHALAAGFHQLPGPQSWGGGGATGWHALAPGFHQLPGPQSGGCAELTPADTAATYAIGANATAAMRATRPTKLLITALSSEAFRPPV
jgi:hypothetical protein